MDLSKALFSSNTCSEEIQSSSNPLLKALENMTLGNMQQVDAEMQGVQEEFEDAWEHAEIQQPLDWEKAWLAQHPDFESIWEQQRFEEGWDSQDIRGTAASIMRALESQNNPKFLDSEFYKFVEKLQSGRARIEDNQLIEEFGNAWGEDDLEKAWQGPNLEAAWQSAENNHFEQLWNGLSPDEELKFEEIWDQMQDEYKDNVMQWEQAWNSGPQDYLFESDNPYSETPNPFEVALNKITSGDSLEAVLCLEAEVQRNPENSEAWALLGKLHSENEEDTKAIAALEKGLEVDPYNLHMLMTLGIAYINEYYHEKAFELLKTWLENHPDYSGVQLRPGDLRESLKEALESACQINPEDPEAYLALGVLQFTDNELFMAEESFKHSAELKPSDPSLWNKLGAALARQNKTDEALECYHRALELKPDYVRTWMNIGLAYSNKNEYFTAARFYLCALSLNPSLSDAYSHLTTAFICMDRMDLMEKLQVKDPFAFADEFQIITREQLPKSNEWVHEFIN